MRKYENAFVEIGYGPESSGKTTVSLHMIAEIQKRNEYIVGCFLNRSVSRAGAVQGRRDLLCLFEIG